MALKLISAFTEDVVWLKWGRMKQVGLKNILEGAFKKVFFPNPDVKVIVSDNDVVVHGVGYKYVVEDDGVVWKTVKSPNGKYIGYILTSGYIAMALRFWETKEDGTHVSHRVALGISTVYGFGAHITDAGLVFVTGLSQTGVPAVATAAVYVAKKDDKGVYQRTRVQTVTGIDPGQYSADGFCSADGGLLFVGNGIYVDIYSRNTAGTYALVDSTSRIRWQAGFNNSSIQTRTYTVSEILDAFGDRERFTVKERDPVSGAVSTLRVFEWNNLNYGNLQYQYQAIVETARDADGNTYEVSMVKELIANTQLTTDYRYSTYLFESTNNGTVQASTIADAFAVSAGANALFRFVSYNNISYGDGTARFEFFIRPSITAPFALVDAGPTQFLWNNAWTAHAAAPISYARSLLSARASAPNVFLYKVVSLFLAPNGLVGENAVATLYICETGASHSWVGAETTSNGYNNVYSSVVSVRGRAVLIHTPLNAASGSGITTTAPTELLLDMSVAWSFTAFASAGMLLDSWIDDRVVLAMVSLSPNRSTYRIYAASTVGESYTMVMEVEGPTIVNQERKIVIADADLSTEMNWFVVIAPYTPPGADTAFLYRLLFRRPTPEDQELIAGDNFPYEVVNGWVIEFTYSSAAAGNSYRYAPPTLGTRYLGKSREEVIPGVDVLEVHPSPSYYTSAEQYHKGRNLKRMSGSDGKFLRYGHGYIEGVGHVVNFSRAGYADTVRVLAKK